MRSDILWAAKRYRESAEQIETLYTDRWREWAPLNDVERRDILRAGISFAIAEDTLGLERFREKFLPIMTQGPDRQAFEVATAPFSASKAGISSRLRARIAAVDTLDQFVRDMRARYPDNAVQVPQTHPPGSQSRRLLPASRRPARLDQSKRSDCWFCG